MVAEVPFHRCGPDTGNVDVPAVDGMAAGCIHCEALLVGLPVYNFHLCKAYPLLVAGRGRDAGNHHEFDQLLGLERQLPPLCLLQPVF